jgi:hypothetical protein
VKNLSFKKTGVETKQAIRNRLQGLSERLERRNKALEIFMKDPKKLRSYLIRGSERQYRMTSHIAAGAPVLYSKNDISSEEKEEINQLCARIYEIEQEINQLNLIAEHLKDDQEMDLSYEELVRFGFGSGSGIEVEA